MKTQIRQIYNKIKCRAIINLKNITFIFDLLPF